MQRDQTPRKLGIQFINTSAYNENSKPQKWGSYSPLPLLQPIVLHSEKKGKHRNEALLLCYGKKKKKRQTAWLMTLGEVVFREVALDLEGQQCSNWGGERFSFFCFALGFKNSFAVSPPPAAAFPQMAACPLGNDALGMCRGARRELGLTVSSVFNSLLDWCSAIGSAAVNPAFIFTRYISHSIFWNSPALMAALQNT